MKYKFTALKRDRYLIIYDISDDKRRTKLAKALSSYGNRVQYSAFEVYISKQQYSKLISNLTMICKDGDDIKIYRINGNIYYGTINSEQSDDDYDFLII